MIKIDPNKEKKLNFAVEIQGIDPNFLEYNLRLSNGNIDYGFKGINENGNIKFTVPPLNDIINNSDSITKIKLEVNDRNNKYYLKSFEDEVKIEKQIKIEAKLSEELDIDKSVPSVKASLNEEEIEEKVIKNTKFSKFIGE